MPIDPAEQEKLRKLSALNGSINRAADAVHGITGRSDQHVNEIIAANPDHEHVKAYLAAVEEKKRFLQS